MKEAIPSTFKLKEFYIKESKFILSKKGVPLNLNIKLNPKGTVIKAENTFILEIDVEIDEREEAVNISVKCIATYQFQQDLEDGLPTSYFITNAPAIAFPYIRAYISTLTSQSGFTTITLPVMNLAPQAEHLRKNITIIE